MKVPTALLALTLASIAAAQTPELPKCAQSCADKFLRGGIGNCGSDPACICANKDFLGSIACCLAGVCDGPSQTQAVGFAANLCKGFGVTDLPTAVACSTASNTGAATTGSSSSSAAAATTAASSSSSAATGTSSAASSSGSSASSSGTAAAASTNKSTNVGPRPTAAAVGLGVMGGVIAAVAML
ncbi:hypothetical protein C8A05DRAFT_36107 [Staphylotrichum tortipilum]|uniref:CFEM domain-containing protein n=1 Tax=Staphylotrichum tortipilum TaxID=2831512 RepID=A0AAN6MGF6_9PEZI|nr:hypothetical protein C8A05DRAFT_36107 [Staphylotrichum longicolle]